MEGGEWSAWSYRKVIGIDKLLLLSPEPRLLPLRALTDAHIIRIDISGKVQDYNPALFNAKHNLWAYDSH